MRTLEIVRKAVEIASQGRRRATGEYPDHLRALPLVVCVLGIVAVGAGMVGATSSGADGGAPLGITSARHVSAVAADAGADATVQPGSDAAEVIEAPPLASGGALTITPTFDVSITGNVNAATIEAAINAAITVLEAQLNDPITVTILFRYAKTNPDGSALPTGALAVSDKAIYVEPWATYIGALTADATTADDATALASLPGSSLSANVDAASADGRAIGLATPPAMFADGSVGAGGPYDGIVTINSKQPFTFTRPPVSGKFDAQRAVEHEMDEVLGFGSSIGVSSDLFPQDLFSWAAAGVRNLTSSGVRYFSIDGGTTDIVGFNQNPQGDFGDWLSGTCPQVSPFVQDAFSCADQASDVATGSPEAIDLDVIGYDVITVPTTTTTTTTLPAICGSTPEVGCRTITTPLKGSVAITVNANPAKDALKWTWKDGAATAVADFKDPVNGSAAYRVCVYDASGNAQPIMNSAALPGGVCGTRPCWTATATGAKYANTAGTPQGLTKATLKADTSAPGQAVVKWQGKGAALPVPALPLTPPVTVQFLAQDNSSTNCWQTTFSGPALVNTTAQFKAKGP